MCNRFVEIYEVVEVEVSSLFFVVLNLTVQLLVSLW
jgi:hypothetical protein